MNDAGVKMLAMSLRNRQELKTSQTIRSVSCPSNVITNFTFTTPPNNSPAERGYPIESLASDAPKANAKISLIETFSKNVIRLRIERGLSRAALSRLSGLKENSLYNIENRLSSARLNTIEKLACALDVQASELLI